jgi:hypothetical protein
VAAEEDESCGSFRRVAATAAAETAAGAAAGSVGRGAAVLAVLLLVASEGRKPWARLACSAYSESFAWCAVPHGSAAFGGPVGIGVAAAA